jgi:two-component system chemotaxis sensor kinase CheA
MGLVVEEIIDIVDADVALERRSDSAVCLGSAIIGGRSTELLDVAHFVNRVFGGWFAEETRQAFVAGVDAPVRRLLLVDDSAFFRGSSRDPGC